MASNIPGVKELLYDFGLVKVNNLIQATDGERKVSVTYAGFVNTLVKPLPYAEDLNHMAMGVAGEAGELVDAIKRITVYEKEPDLENIREELGDLLFYMQRLAFVFELPLKEILQSNVEKLEKRYHQKKFSVEQANERADKKA